MEMKGRSMKYGKHMLTVLMSMALVLTFAFMPAVPNLGLGAEDAYGATGDVVVDSEGNRLEGNYKGMDWKIVEKSDGTYELRLGNKETTQVLDREEAATQSLEQGFTINPDTGEYEREEIFVETSYQEAYDGAIASVKQYPWAADDDVASSVTSASIEGDIKAKGSLDAFFAGLINCKNITGLGKIDTSEILLMRNLFGYALPVESQSNPGIVDYWKSVPNSLESVVVPYWNLKKLISMECIFAGCVKVQEVNLGFDTTPLNTSEGGNLISIGGLFDGCASLENVYIGDNFDISSVDFAHNLFRGCTSLKNVDVGWLKNCKAKQIYGMFNKCRNLETISNLDKLDTSNAEHLGFMFSECHNLKSIDLSNFDTGKVTSMQSMFFEVGMKNPDFPGLDVSTFDTSKVTSMNSMFAGNTNTPEIKGLSGFDTSNVTDMFNMFMKCDKIDDTAILGFDIDKVQNSAGMLTRCSGIVAKLDEMSKSDQYSAETKAKLADAKAKVEALTTWGTTTEQVKAALSTVAGELKDAAKEDAQSAINNTTTQEVTNAVNNASAATKKAYDDAKAELDKVLADPNATANDINKATAALNDAVANLTPKSSAEQAYSDAKAAADALAKSKPGSDEAIKAAEDAYAKATEWQKAAEAVLEDAKKSGDADRIAAAEAQKAEADKGKADASSVVAEQKTKKAENLAKSNPGSDEAKKAADEAKKAADQAVADNTAAYGPNAPQTQATQNTQKQANTIVQQVNKPAVKVGDRFTVGKQVYKVRALPGATWDGEVTLIKAKNAKNVSIPKTVKIKGSKYEVSRIGANAFKAKKIRKVTVGVNVEKIEKNAFKKSKATTIVLKTKSLTKARVKAALKGSKVKTVQVKVGSKKVNKKYVKKYKKIFTTKIAGKKVTVK